MFQYALMKRFVRIVVLLLAMGLAQCRQQGEEKSGTASQPVTSSGAAVGATSGSGNQPGTNLSTAIARTAKEAIPAKVSLSDGEEYTGKVVGTDPKTDLAVIRIPASDKLPALHFGNSENMEVGDWVVAIGSPQGLYQTVTQGIISAKHRRGITEANSYQDYLQTDAAINPGNSGGPLLNLQGEIIGVNSAALSQSGGFEGIGFAIPSNIAVHVTKQLIEHGKVERGWLGVNIQNLAPDLVKSFGLKSTKGALVSEVVKGSPADEAGIKRRDVITGYRGNQITDADSLRDAVANTPLGKT